MKKIVFRVPGRMPSWNAILGMNHWQRAKFKTDLQKGFLCALQQSGRDSSTPTTSARNTMSIAAATLASYLETIRQKRLSKQRSARLEKASKSTSKSR